MTETIIKRLEEEITNMQGMKYHCNVRFDDAIQKLGYKIKVVDNGNTVLTKD